MKAAFTMGAVTRSINDFVDDRIRKLVLVLSYIGEQYVNRARSKTRAEGSFNDRTGNLRSSIGYVVAVDGEVKQHAFEGDEAEGRAMGENVGKMLAGEFSHGVVLIVVAGMEYAAAVESRGFDVITGSSPLAEELKQIFKEELGTAA